MNEKTPATAPSGSAAARSRSGQPDAEPTPIRDDPLIVDDLMLLLMHDDGASVQRAGTVHYTLGGAVLTELALLGRVEVDDSVNPGGPRVTPSGEGPLPDPLLQSAYDTIAEKPQRVQTLLATIGLGLWLEVIDRLADRGLVRRESRVLDVFRSTRWPAADDEHTVQLKTRIRRALEDGEDPDPRTAAIIGLLLASGAMPSLRPPLPWTSTTVTRAMELHRGHGGSQAVASAVTYTAMAIATSSAAIAISVPTSAR